MLHVGIVLEHLKQGWRLIVELVMYKMNRLVRKLHSILLIDTQ